MLLVLLRLPVGVVIVIAMVALTEMLQLLVFHVDPCYDEVAEFLEVSRSVLGKLAILVTVTDAFAEGVDDVIVGELNACGLLLPETTVVVT